ncbi:MAG: hypothetical protein AAFR21_18375 [Pseudomonadota bacterium]
MLEYQKQNSVQSLSEGIAEYFLEHEQYFGSRKMTSEAVEFFRCHDVAHVVFGCDISLNDELVVKISSMFGTTAGFGVLRGYNLAESKEVYDELGVFDALRTAAKSIVLIPMTLWRCFCMRKRWCWDNFDDYLELPLNQLRDHFGVRVAH